MEVMTTSTPLKGVIRRYPLLNHLQYVVLGVSRGAPFINAESVSGNDNVIRYPNVGPGITEGPVHFL